jgi:hypothetical protein
MSDPTNDFRVTEPPACVGCHGPNHGSVNVERLCLIAAVEALRAERAELLEELAPIRRIRAEVAALAPSHVNARGK